MGNTKNIIKVEERLTDMFNFLPKMKNSKDEEFKPVFKYGDNFELLKFLTTINKGKDPYPLIWLVYPYVEMHTISKVNIQQLTFILAVQTNRSMLNDERMKVTYDKVLMPLCDNIRELFKQSNIIHISDEYKIIKFPNYSNDSNEGDSNQTVALWDAIKITFDCTINGNCLFPIKF